MPARKLIDRKDVLTDLLEVIYPKYFPDQTADNNRVSIFGYVSEALAKSIEDTVILEQRRSADYCPELSNSEIRVKQTAKIRGVDVSYATPGQCFVMLGILKSDILEKGTKVGDEIRFVIDRRSAIMYQNTTFSLEDDIVIRAVRYGNDYIYSVQYQGDRASNTSYIQVFEDVDDLGRSLLAMICRVYQYNYNISSKTVTDDLEFQYDGIPFDYENRLAGFEVYYRQSSNMDFTLLQADHYLTTETTKCIYYNDDESNILYILNNPQLNIGVNAEIRVEIKETLGTAGSITIVDGNGAATFTMYKDSAYSYSGVNVQVAMLSDVTGATDGDSLSDIKAKLIDAKTRRDNVTTEHDIIEYINDQDANVQIIKKRNDYQDRSYYMYTLVRYGDNNIAPACTKNLVITGIKSDEDFGDFDEYDSTVDRKIIHAYNKFKVIHSNEIPDMDYAVKVNVDDPEEEGYFYVTCPYMILIDSNNISAYYFTSIDTAIELARKVSQDSFPFQIITQSVRFYRDSHNKENSDTYTITVEGTMNTANDTSLVDDEGNLLDMECMKAYLIFNREGSPAAYMELSITGYNPSTRIFTFSGSIKTNDYITEKDTLQITNGLFTIGTDTVYDSVIDFSDAQFQLYFTYKYDNSAGTYPKNDEMYTMIPDSKTSGYIMMCGYYNTTNNLLNMILEFNKFSRSPVLIEKESVDSDVLVYTLREVPFFEFDFGVEYTHTLFDTFERMYTVYGNLLKQTTDFEVSLKFINTYGPSKYITVTGGRDSDGNEIETPLNNLNPQLRFRVYGTDLVVADLYNFIYQYMRDNFIINTSIFVSNIITDIENSFNNVKSVKYLGVDNFDASYQEFTYHQPAGITTGYYIENPSSINQDVITRYIPEQFNISDIQIEIDES